MIQVTNITFSHTGIPLYENTSFSVPKNKKAGLVGLNGSGKSTLFRILLEEEWPEEGKVRIEGTVILVPQEVSRDPRQLRSATIRDYLKTAKSLNDDHLRDYLSNMELNDISLDDKPSGLSGGQKTKLAILHAVLSEPDILLLDEPTNFLDTAGKKWVMHWLSCYKKTLLIVSHDLDLLDKAIDKVVYINKQTRQFEEYTGNYTKFKKLKFQHDEHLTRYIRNQEQKVKKMKKSVENLRRSNVEKVIRQRVLLEKRIQKIQDTLPKIPKEVVRIRLQLPTPAHIGSLPLLVKNLSKQFDGKLVIKNLSCTIERGQRIALIGQNGAGKSTFIKCVLGLNTIDQGQVKLDERAKVGYYSQEFETFNINHTLFDFVRVKTELPEGRVRSFLGRFMFRGNVLHQTISSLSGGEKTRLAVAMLMLQDYNFLILDEPTTYLDVLSQRIILEALKAYNGTMLVVSHTPDFLRELRPHKAILLPEEKMVYWSNALTARTAFL